ncbi:hypothetical protein Pst134EA_022897 [Puccinia striiformis f. sp. tritici]|uniref:hypothetical protein n=1 Tax=Puccinia striiformis f. sp. tritici TaxID=168172 RepID=UPI0020078879|nr:hypothetical protein Pst134EA_022897 [Puccinia striiformis f. sp. tritici]KAH9455432.1 hypothetical protein Pst134EA_022897 [Puccinia striiformis f. sp. tritici]
MYVLEYDLENALLRPITMRGLQAHLPLSPLNPGAHPTAFTALSNKKIQKAMHSFGKALLLALCLNLTSARKFHHVRDVCDVEDSDAAYDACGMKKTFKPKKAFWTPEPIIPYKSPNPQVGTHEYVILVFEEAGAGLAAFLNENSQNERTTFRPIQLEDFLVESKLLNSLIAVFLLIHTHEATRPVDERIDQAATRGKQDCF